MATVSLCSSDAVIGLGTLRFASRQNSSVAEAREKRRSDFGTSFDLGCRVNWQGQRSGEAVGASASSLLASASFHLS